MWRFAPLTKTLTVVQLCNWLSACTTPDKMKAELAPSVWVFPFDFFDILNMLNMWRLWKRVYGIFLINNKVTILTSIHQVILYMHWCFRKKLAIKIVQTLLKNSVSSKYATPKLYPHTLWNLIAENFWHIPVSENRGLC